MSEMVLIVPVIALTAFVLVGILVTFRKYVRQRDQLDREFLAAQAEAGTPPRAETPARRPQLVREAEPRRIAA